MSDTQPTLRLGIPKGSLQDTTQQLFVRAGYDLRISGRSYYPSIDDAEIQCILIRPQEMARSVAQGIIDCAITGLDWILENDVEVTEMADLRAPWPNYGVVRWVMASKEGSPFNTVKDLQGRRIATEAVGMTRRFPADQARRPCAAGRGSRVRTGDIVFGLSRSFPLSVAAYMAVGLADQVSVVMRHTAIQLATPDELRGRVSSVNFLFIGASNQLGAAESGFVAALTSATFAVVSGGAACPVVLAIVAWKMPQLRAYKIGT